MAWRAQTESRSRSVRDASSAASTGGASASCATAGGAVSSTVDVRRSVREAKRVVGAKACAVEARLSATSQGAISSALLGLFRARSSEQTSAGVGPRPRRSAGRLCGVKPDCALSQVLLLFKVVRSIWKRTQKDQKRHAMHD